MCRDNCAVDCAVCLNDEDEVFTSDDEIEVDIGEDEI